MIVCICVGSSCHLKGAETIIELFQKAVADHHLEDKVTLTGSFCLGRCNRTGVTIEVDGTVYTGIIKETFDDFFRSKIAARF